MSGRTLFDSVGALVLAAGKGTRMRSDKPKVLHGLLGRPMLWHAYRALEPLFGRRVRTVIGHGAEEVRKAFPDRLGSFVVQKEQLGTGHALREAWAALVQDGYDYCVVLNGDTPLVAPEALGAFTETCLAEKADLSFIGIHLDDPGAYGRVVRGASGRSIAIVEAKDYDAAIHGPATGEINSGVYFLRLAAIEPLLSQLGNDNKSGEFYITDLVGLAVDAGLAVTAYDRGVDPDLLGVNSPRELVQAEARLARRVVEGWFDRGVVIRFPEGARIGPEVVIGPGTEINGPCEIYGRTVIGEDVFIGANTWISDCELASGSSIFPFSHLEGAVVGEHCGVGPYCRLRPGARLMKGAKAGNFVEVKKSILGEGVKAGHLTYLGDAEIGAGTNIGAGTITCNYDGKNKHKTVIGENTFIGSNTALVAPVSVGGNALVGAGSVITRDVPEGDLAVARSRQKNLARKK